LDLSKAKSCWHCSEEIGRDGMASTSMLAEEATFLFLVNLYPGGYPCSLYHFSIV